MEMDKVEAFYEANQEEGMLSDENMQKLLDGDIDLPEEPKLEEPEASEEPEEGKQEQGTPEEEGMEILSRNGKYTIPYEKLASERELNKELRARLERTQAELEALRVPQEQPEGEVEGESKLDSLRREIASELNDFPELSKFVDLVEESGRNQTEQIRMLTDKLQQMEMQRQQVSAAEEHQNAIISAHPDVSDILESKQYEDWKAGLPAFIRQSCEAVEQQGTAEQVNSMLHEFKSQSGWGKPALPDKKEEAKKEEDVPKKSTGPVTMSDIPGGGKAAPHDEAEAVLALPPDKLMEKLEGMSSDKLGELYGRLKI